MSVKYYSSTGHPKICASLNVLNRGVLTAVGEGVNAVAVICSELM